ncbi:hypothetical protein NDN08_003885 [Rhodosorus marinus]|uniref:HpcH/HpaI aldolase/citrate lyase domain-containing protein n=1 Tax=Rhodosorus marinus TaxID=101924 RepID=A0AAV8UGR0_9RHOD|nr:hypothetical protein NDN08_003885 [Rhodosorus marinus]
MLRLRSLLFSPGNVPKMLSRLETVAEADAFVPDLEDSVPKSEKAAARVAVGSWLERIGEERLKGNVRSHLVPRVNSLRSGLFEEDLEAVIAPGVDAVTVGKVDDAKDVLEIAHAMTEVERVKGIERGTVKLVPWLETALGIVNAFQICSAHSRVGGVAFGGEDFKTDMGIGHSNFAAEFLFPRRVISLCARAARVAAFDTPWTVFKDQEGHAKDCEYVSQLGFTGRFCIHPDGVGTVNTAFTPSPESVARATGIIKAYEQAESLHQRGSVNFEGESVDFPVYERAKALVEKASRT